eukprot:763959-Hanusia_phi.AAC.17
MRKEGLAMELPAFKDGLQESEGEGYYSYHPAPRLGTAESRYSRGGPTPCAGPRRAHITAASIADGRHSLVQGPEGVRSDAALLSG